MNWSRNSCWVLLMVDEEDEDEDEDSCVGLSHSMKVGAAWKHIFMSWTWQLVVLIPIFGELIWNHYLWRLICRDLCVRKAYTWGWYTKGKRWFGLSFWKLFPLLTILFSSGICTEREREREKGERDLTHTHTHTHTEISGGVKENDMQICGSLYEENPRIVQTKSNL